MACLTRANTTCSKLIKAKPPIPSLKRVTESRSSGPCDNLAAACELDKKGWHARVSPFFVRDRRRHSMSRLSRTTFVQLLIGKSICEALVVTAVAAGFFLATTNPALRGWLDHADAQTISGWAVDDNSPDRRVEVQLFIDDSFIEQRSAN